MKKVVNILLISTFFCNYKCKFCFIGDKLNTVTTYWDKEKIVELFEDMQLFEEEIFFDIRVTWGEPLLQEQCIRDVLEYIQEKKLKEKIVNFTIVTNGVHLKKLIALEKQIAYLWDKFVLDVSFHGFEKTYEWLVERKWVWKQVLENIEIFSKKYRLMVNIVVNHQNVLEIPKLILFLLAKGITDFNLLYVSFVWYAEQHKQELYLNYFDNNIWVKEIYKLFSHLNGKKVGERILNLTFTINFPNCQLELLGNNKKRIKNQWFDFIYNIFPKYYFKSYSHFTSEDFEKIKHRFSHNHIGWYSDFKSQVQKPGVENTICYSCDTYEWCNLYTDKINFLLDKILYENEHNTYAHYFEQPLKK